MNLDAIHWHDCSLRRVIEQPDRDLLVFEVDYPVDWESGRFAPREIHFSDVYTYEIHEGPFAGAPTLLAASAGDEDEFGTRVLRIETNAGYRVVRCRSIQLVEPTAG